VDCVRSKDEEKQAVKSVSEILVTSRGSLVLSCGVFLSLPGCFKNIFSSVIAASCRHKVQVS